MAQAADSQATLSLEAHAQTRVPQLDLRAADCAASGVPAVAIAMVDLFCGAGGLTLGLEAAGFRSVLAVECDEDSCRTYSRAFPEAALLQRRIEGVDFRGLEGQIGLVAGGPPCQPFSSGGMRLGHRDSRDMLPEFLRAVREMRPDAFVMENVPGLTTGARRQCLQRFVAGARRLGYRVAWRVLTAAEYGVPQKRQRLFVVGSVFGEFSFPTPTTDPAGPGLHARNFLDPNRILGQPNPSKVVYARNPDLRPSAYDGHVFNGGGRPIDPDDLCPTILATAGGNKTPFLDPSGEVVKYHAELQRGSPPRSGALPGARRITAEEAALIQTFPRAFEFSGSRSSRYRQIGNAVPPLLARHLGEALYEHLASALATRKGQSPREARRTG